MQNLLYEIKRRGQRLGRDRSGQALIEFSLPAVFLILLIFGLIDFAIPIYYREVMINVSREGSNIAARIGTSTPAAAVSTALVTVVQSANPLLIMGGAGAKGQGRVIVSAIVSSSGGSYNVIAQAAEGGLTAAQAPSKVAPNGVGRIPASNLPKTGIYPQIPYGHTTLYVTEVYYKFHPASPLGGLVRFVMTNELYDAAYF
jgi:Flp pilus assembly protein TadG